MIDRDQRKKALIITLIIGLAVAWFAGRWSVEYLEQQRAEELAEQFEDFVEDLDDSQIIDPSDIEDLGNDFLPSPEDLGSCEADGVTYAHGEDYYDGCNTCGCNYGEWICTEKACEPAE